MVENKNKVYEFIDNILNNRNSRNIDYFDDVCVSLSSLFLDSSIGIFIAQDDEYILYSGLKNKNFIDKNYKLDFNKIFNKKNVPDEIITKPDELLNKYTVINNLEINGSIFGYILISSNTRFTANLIEDFRVLSNVISYKIKDYELSNVYKIQLKALQDAITDKKNAYDVIKKQHSKMKELDKAKNLFLANISHELRTPLNAIIGFSQALDAQIFGPLNEKQAEYIQDIQISSLHLLGMINEILDISKLEAKVIKFNPNIMNANSSIQEVCNILQPLYKNKNIKLIFDSFNEIQIFADIQKFQQIIYNLLSNAIKFTNNDGKIEIKSFIRDKNYCLEVIDNGIGIDKKNHNKIFKKYFHLDNMNANVNSSTGLGLTITKELVKLHNGKINVESKLNKGSRFIMEFENIVR